MGAATETLGGPKSTWVSADMEAWRGIYKGVNPRPTPLREPCAHLELFLRADERRSDGPDGLLSDQHKCGTEDSV